MSSDVIHDPITLDFNCNLLCQSSIEKMQCTSSEAYF